MPQEVAVALTAVTIALLFLRDRKRRPMTSWSLWIPLLWVMILGSRGYSYWFTLDIDPEAQAAAYLQGSPADRNIYLLLISTGIVALWRRRIRWAGLFGANRCLLAFVVYCGLSIAWSDVPFLSLKAWIKDVGNMIMALIIFSETDLHAAIKAVFARYTYFALLLSALFVTALPEMGSYYALSTNELLYCGVTTNKNEFGEILAICGVFLVKDLMQKTTWVGPSSDKFDLVLRLVMTGMVLWLLEMAGSSTAIGCLTLGSTLLVLMHFPALRSQVRHLGVYSLALGCLILFLNIPEVLKALVELLGRDMTFTGRTDIWAGLLSEPVNPVLGAGFHAFWLTPGMMERYDNINQAHNGYLETYLNGGLCGLLLLLALVVAVGGKLRNQLLRKEGSDATLLFSFFVVGVIYNLTEAMFARMSLIWFVFLLASFSYPPASEALPERDLDLDRTPSNYGGVTRCSQGK